MPLLRPLTRDEIPADLLSLWDECARSLPSFANLWATMAHSPTVFRHVWGQLLERKRTSPVAARHFEIGIVVVSALNRCTYCVSNHAPLAERAGLPPERLTALAGLTLGPLAEDHDFPPFRLHARRWTGRRPRALPDVVRRVGAGGWRASARRAPSPPPTLRGAR